MPDSGGQGEDALQDPDQDSPPSSGVEEENSMGWVYHDPIKGDQPMSQGPLMPSIRQIAHELEQSISRHLAAGTRLDSVMLMLLPPYGSV